MKLEDELARALRREQPPADFADRVAAKIDAASRLSPRTPASPVSRRFVGLLTAAAIATATGSSLYFAHRRQVSEAERVRSEAVLGLRIASAKLNEVHNKLLERLSIQEERPR